jgi:Holliday junction DNA helicase RuvA
MIAYVRGILAEKEPARVVLEAGGVGYELFIPLSTYEKLGPAGKEQKLLTCHIVREDDETLFGFATEGEKAMFQKLTLVSGVGPKIALAILSGTGLGELMLAISTGNAKRLASIKGVGKKTAEKICVELRDKVNAIEALAGAKGEGGKPVKPYIHDAVLALSALGFSDETANKMVADVVSRHPEADDTEKIIRLALKSK